MDKGSHLVLRRANGSFTVIERADISGVVFNAAESVTSLHLRGGAVVKINGCTPSQALGVLDRWLGRLEEVTGMWYDAEEQSLALMVRYRPRAIFISGISEDAYEMVFDHWIDWRDYNIVSQPAIVKREAFPRADGAGV